MKVIEIKTKEIQLNYNTSIKVGSTEFKKKTVYQLEVHTDAGIIETELSLIDGFHEVNYSDCLHAYKNDLSNIKNWHPQIKYPIDTALFSLAMPKLNSGRIFINGYYDPSLSSKAPNIDCLKVKIGRGSFDKESIQLKKLADKILRLDANQSLNQEQFKKFLGLGLKYDYFEEPFADITDIAKFPNESFALDENVSNDQLMTLPQVTTLVIKPTLLGLDQTLSLIEKAKQMGKRVVISSTFEGELGLLALLRIALYADDYLGQREQHGLGSISFLSDPLKKLGICARNGSIEITF